MTTQAKIILAILLLGGATFAYFRWSDKIAPAPKGNETASIDPAKFKADQAKAAQDSLLYKTIHGDKDVTLIGDSAIPPVTGTSDYKKEQIGGKTVVTFPINVWPGWAPIIAANNGMEPNEGSVFARKYGFLVRLVLVDDPVKARDLFASGQTHVLWGTLDMIALFAPSLSKDSRTSPVVSQQIDFSDGGDGVVARGDIRSINDFRPLNGRKRKVVLAQNSPSHYLIMALLLDAGIDPSQVDFKWVADAPSAAKIFVVDESFDAFVGWAPDIYIVPDKVAGSRLVVTTEQANRLVADVYAVRNDFYRDNKKIVMDLARGIFDGIEMVRKDAPAAAGLMAKAFNLPSEDALMMIGKDGGIIDGDAHLTNYRENAAFFLDPLNPSSFEVVWSRATSIYKSLGIIQDVVPPARVKNTEVLLALSQEYKDSKDLSQPVFRPGALTRQSAEAGTDEILTKAIIIMFKPSDATMDAAFDKNIPVTLEEIGSMAGAFGNAYIVIEGNTDASKKGQVPGDLVRQLSYDRASAVRKAILEKYPSFNPDKFKVVGNGWDNPVPGLTDPSNPEHNRRNRRVEVKVFPLEK